MPSNQTDGGRVNLMVTPRHLSRAPIVEAIIHLQVKLPPEIDHTKLLTFHELIKEQYPSRKARITGRFKIEVPPGGFAKPELENKGIVGYILHSTNGKQIVQALVDNFAFSRLHPYESWEKERDEAKRLWTTYANVVSPVAIKRVALRYINRLEVPQDMKGFNEYLTSPPTLPDALPQAVKSFLSRIVIQEPSLKATAIITQALEPPTNPKTVPIILDIDVFRETDYDPRGDEVWDYLDQLRVFKNSVFFESITEKITEMYS